MNINDINVKEELRIVFMGTPQFAVPILQGLIDHYHVRAVVTQPDKPVGRNGKIAEPPVKTLAKEHTILVLQPTKIKEEWQEIIALKPNLIITCAYGQMLPLELLMYPTYGCINVHASLLPKLRGGAPIHHAIIEGHKKTGITIMHMSSKMDQGDMIAQTEIPIEDTDTASSLYDKLQILGKDLLLEVIPSIIDGTAPRIKQDESQATYAFNITREDEKLHFDVTKKQIYNQIRGLNSWPGAYTTLDSKIIKVWECYYTENTYPTLFDGQITKLYPDGIGVKVSNGEVVFTIIQPEGKNKMKATDFINGYQNKDSLIDKIFE